MTVGLAGAHHPSCKPSDNDLVWHCNQCGLNEFAETEILDAHKKQISALISALKAAEEALEWHLKNCIYADKNDGGAKAALTSIKAAREMKS